MSDQPIYRWRGQYFGFISNERLFDASSHYLGWIESDGRVWRKNGTFMGEIVDQNYILRRTTMATPAIRAIRAIPATPAVRAIRATRAARAIRASYVDALDEFG